MTREQITNLIKGSNKTQLQIEAESGVTRRTLYNIMHDRPFKSTTADALAKWAKDYGHEELINQTGVQLP